MKKEGVHLVSVEYAFSWRMTWWLVFAGMVVTSSFSQGASAQRKTASETNPPALNEIKSRLQSVEDQLAKTRSELDSVKASRAESKIDSKVDLNGGLYDSNTNNQTFVRTGISLISPRNLTLNGNSADDGVGAFLGVGQYIGKHHVGEFAFEYDLYPSLTLRYRFEFHPKIPAIAISPVIGYKIKIATFRPMDNFLSNPDDVKSSFFLFGANLAIPLVNSAVVFEFLYLLNSQAFFFTNVGVQFFI